LKAEITPAMTIEMSRERSEVTTTGGTEEAESR
jgi:hypothetical protein